MDQAANGGIAIGKGSLISPGASEHSAPVVRLSHHGRCCSGGRGGVRVRKPCMNRSLFISWAASKGVLRSYLITCGARRWVEVGGKPTGQRARREGPV